MMTSLFLSTKATKFSGTNIETVTMSLRSIVISDATPGTTTAFWTKVPASTPRTATTPSKGARMIAV